MTYPQVHDLGPPHPARELDSRMGDGIEIRLLWLQSDDRVTVAVIDTKTRCRTAPTPNLVYMARPLEVR